MKFLNSNLLKNNKKFFLILLILTITFTSIFAQNIKVGGDAPDFSLTLSTGEKVSLETYKGKGLFLHFWATWCPPCKKELPELEKLSKELQKQGDSSKLNFLAVCISDTQKAFSSFMKSNGYTFPGGLDAKGDIAIDYRIQGVPTSILISPEGKIQKIYVGMMSPEQLKNFISEYEK